MRAQLSFRLAGKQDHWSTAGSVSEDEAPASLSSQPPGQPREVFLFGHLDGGWGVWRSKGGVDTEFGRIRVVTSTEGLELLSDLAEPFELSGIYTPNLALAIDARFELIDWAEMPLADDPSPR